MCTTRMGGVSGRWQINRERSVRLQWIHSHKRSFRSRFLFQIPSDKEAHKKLLYGSNHFLFFIRTRPNQLDALYCLGPLCLWECFCGFCFMLHRPCASRTSMATASEIVSERNKMKLGDRRNKWTRQK